MVNSIAEPACVNNYGRNMWICSTDAIMNLYARIPPVNIEPYCTWAGTRPDCCW